MTARTPVHRLHVATELHQFIETQVLPGTGVATDQTAAAKTRRFSQSTPHSCLPTMAALVMG